jgi:hypothetical protein
MLSGFYDQVRTEPVLSRLFKRSLILKKDDTILTSGLRAAAANHLVQFPAGFEPIFISKTGALLLFGTAGNLPARGIIQEFLNSFNADFFGMN